MRIIGIDLGTRRVGLALGDTETCIASPLEIVKVRNSGMAVEEVVRRAKELSVDFIVVGLARNMSGKLGPKGKECLAFAENLKKNGLQVETFDERLTTVQAERSLLDADMSRKKRSERLDAVAAQVILQNYLDFKRLKQS